MLIEYLMFLDLIFQILVQREDSVKREIVPNFMEFLFYWERKVISKWI